MAKADFRGVVSFFAVCGGLAACAQLGFDAPSGPPAPREIHLGSAEMAIQSVEREVSREEVAAAIQGMVSGARMCMPWPSLWLEGDERRNVFLARFDLMARDWGEAIAGESERRMQEFVDLGLLTRRERPDVGARAVIFVLTSEGGVFLDGSPYGGERPSFCMPSERQVSEITAMQWGAFECGSLRVNFTHVAQTWPSWARTEAARARFVETWSAIGEPMPGSVTLSRQWYRPGVSPPGGQRNGDLRSVCYDSERQRVTGDDLNLNAVDEPAAAISPAPEAAARLN